MSGIPGEYIFDLIGRAQDFYEKALLEVLDEYSVNSQGVAVDVGANIGNHTVFFGAILGREVVAIEPDPRNGDLLEENVRINGLSDSVRVIRAAAWDSETTVALTLNNENNRGAISAVEADTGIPTVVLDKVVGATRVGVLKIDVEGAELHVLRGAAEVIARDKPLISIEAHTSDMRSATGKFMEDLGYQTIRIAGESDNYVWIHPDSDASGGRARWMRAEAEGRRSAERWNREIGATVAAVRAELATLGTKLDEQRASDDDESVRMAALSDSNPSDAVELKSLLGLLVSRVEELAVKLGHHGSEITRLAASAASPFELGTALEGIRNSVGSMERALGERFERGLSERAEEHADDLESALCRLTGVLTSNHAELRARVTQADEKIAEIAQKLNLLVETDDRRSVEASAMDDQVSEVVGALAEKVDSLSGVSDGHRELGRNQDHIVQRVDLVYNLLSEMKERLEPIKAEPAEVDSAGSPAEVRLEKLLNAYAMLARRLERLAPERWNAAELVDAVRRGVQADPKGLDASDPIPGRQSAPAVPPSNAGGPFGSARELTRGSGQAGGPTDPLEVPGAATRRDRVRVGIASMPGREAGLSTVLEVISPQADEVFVYLNGMASVPDSLPRRHNVRYFTGPDLGDRGKFSFIRGFHGYYLTVDDDIEYAPFHVQSIIDGIERYGRTAVVGWHGSIFKDSFENFYDARSRQVLSFRTLRGKDTPVNLLGTGVCGFHTETIRVAPEDFTIPNMADAFLAVLAKDQGVAMMVLAHGNGWANPIDVGPSISTVSLGRDKSTTKSLDVAKVVTEMVKANAPWPVIEPRPRYRRPSLAVAFIGRTDRGRWKKGGILKSAHLTVDSLRRFGVEVALEDIETGDPEGLSGRQADIVMLYVGDPERPDFSKVEKLIAVHAAKGRKVLVNLSYNGVPSRTEFIARKMAEFRANYGRAVRLMVFTEAMFADPGLTGVKDLLVLIPKTLTYSDEPVAEFAHSRGVFIGDIAKLSDDALLEFPAEEWIAAIRAALPGEPIYAVQQYKPKAPRDLDIDEVWPFLSKEQFTRRIGACRVMVSTVKHATFEMVPVETAAIGVPVIYPEMPQSLSEYLGMAGVCVRSPEELSRVLGVIYHDPIVWRSQSEAGIARAHSSGLDNTSGQLFLRLVALATEKD